MNTAPPLRFSFEPRMLHIEYRDVLEHIDTLDGPKPVVDQEVESMEVEMPCSPPMSPAGSPRAITVATTEATTGAVVVTNPPAGSVVHTLFHYTEEPQIQRLALPIQSVLETVRQRYMPLLGRVEELRDRIQTMLRVFARSLLMGVLSRDEHGARIAQIQQRLDELYVWYDDREVPQGRLNWAHADRVQSLMEQVTRESLDHANDKWYAKCADVRKRGRKPGSEKENPPHALNRLKAEYIESQKTVPPVCYNEQARQFELQQPYQGPVPPSAQLLVNYYPAFVKVLSCTNDMVPRASNHGWFTQTVRQAVRQLTPREWPMHGLVQSLLNLEAVLERRRVRVTRGGLFCCYSGQPLVPGEEVWLLRLLVRSHERQRAWQANPPLQPWLDPLLEKSVRCYMLKTKLCSVTSLFYTPLPDAYRAKFPHYFASTNPFVQPLATTATVTTTSSTAATKRAKTTTRRTLPLNRRYCCHTLWCALAQLLRFATDNQLAPMLWERHRESLQTRLVRMRLVWDTLDTLDWATHLDYALFTSLTGHASYEAMPPEQRDSAVLREYVGVTRDIVLDWLDLTLEFVPPVQHDAVEDGLCTAQFAVQALGLKPDETQRAPSVKPQLHASQHLLRALLQASDKRHCNRATPLQDAEKRSRMQRLQQHLVRHPFLFLSLHDACFARCDELPLLGFPDALQQLKGLGIELHSA